MFVGHLFWGEGGYFGGPWEPMGSHGIPWDPRGPQMPPQRPILYEYINIYIRITRNPTSGRGSNALPGQKIKKLSDPSKMYEHSTPWAELHQDHFFRVPPMNCVV